MKLRVIFVYTHDSIGLGEDGPTHQPVEQLTALRATPNLYTWRPCDTVESAVAWKFAVESKHNPSALIFSRQNLPHQQRTAAQVTAIEKGAYILKDCAGIPEIIIIATGSEVGLAMQAAEALVNKNTGKKVRVVSMPCAEIFEKQDKSYRESVLPSSVTKRVAIEAGHRDFWYKYVGLNGVIVGMSSFGESAPAEALFKQFGFTVENVVEKINSAFAT